MASEDNVKKLVGSGERSRTILCEEEANTAMTCYLNEHVYRSDRQVLVKKVMKRGKQLVLEYIPKTPEESTGFNPVILTSPAAARKQAVEPPEVLSGEYACEVCGTPISGKQAAINGRCGSCSGIGHHGGVS